MARERQHGADDGPDAGAVLRSWFELSERERWWLGGVLAIFLVGLIARYAHLKSRRPDVYEPAGLEQLEGGERP